MIALLFCAIDLTTGQEAISTRPAEPHEAQTSDKAGAVLWDQTHGVYIDYRLMGSFSALYNLLISNGYTAETTVVGVNNLNLDVYRVVVLCLASNWNSAYSVAEADSLQAYVARGGSVLVMSDNTGCPNGNLTEVLNRFNMAAGLGTPGDCLSNSTTNPTYTPIFSGVSSACGSAAGTIGASSPSELIAWASGVGMMAGRCQNGQGGVVLIWDINIWDNSDIGGYNNATLALNTFNWLSNPPCSPTGSDEAPSRPESSLSVSPNPCAGYLDVILPSGCEAATLFNALGAPVMSLGQGEADISGLAGGVYFLRAGNQVKRVVKR